MRGVPDLGAGTPGLARPDEQRRHPGLRAGRPGPWADHLARRGLRAPQPVVARAGQHGRRRAGARGPLPGPLTGSRAIGSGARP